MSEVEQITFSGDYARKTGQTVYYVTERAVFKLMEEGLELIEIAPGMDLQKDILEQMDFEPKVSDSLRPMSEALFRHELLGLDKQSEKLVSERLHYNPESNTVFLHFEGLRLDSVAEVEKLECYLESYFSKLGKKVKAVVNYDNFSVSPAAESAYFEILRKNQEKYFLSSARYSTDAFFRRKVGQKFAEAKAELYDSYSEALEKL